MSIRTALNDVHQFCVESLKNRKLAILLLEHYAKQPPGPGKIDEPIAIRFVDPHAANTDGQLARCQHAFALARKYAAEQANEHRFVYIDSRKEAKASWHAVAHEFANGSRILAKCFFSIDLSQGATDRSGKSENLADSAGSVLESFTNGGWSEEAIDYVVEQLIAEHADAIEIAAKLEPEQEEKFVRLTTAEALDLFKAPDTRAIKKAGAIKAGGQNAWDIPMSLFEAQTAKRKLQ